MLRVMLALASLSIPIDTLAVDTSKLVKVTGDSNQKCVEYYTYRGESYCSLIPLSNNAEVVNEKDIQKIKFDDQPWRAAWAKKTSDSLTIEYVPMGESINHWNELVTSQFYEGIQEDVSPEIFMVGEMTQLRDAKLKPVVTILKKTPTMVLFEFRILEPKEHVQDEIQKITKGPNGIYVLHYVIKQADMGKVKRSLWVNNLLQSTIK